MRYRLLLIVVSLLCAVTASAQDILVKSDGTALKVKVQEIGETVVRYYRYDNLTGPLYTIPISSILSITYENGTTETFGKATSPAAQTQTAPGTNLTPQNPDGYNENELYRIANQMGSGYSLTSWEQYMTRAKKYRKIGWYGGAAFLVVGCVAPLAITGEDWDFWYCSVGAPTIVAGAIWCLAWNLAANNQIKKAKMAMAYSVPLMEWDLLSAGSSSLSASVNLMGNNLMQHRSYGLGVGLNFKF